MNPINLQKQIRDNNNDLMNFCADLKQWGEEMKQKDTQLKEEKSNITEVPTAKKCNKQPVKSKKEDLKNKSIKGFDYSAWEKFDAEAECAKIDEENSGDGDESGELTDECDETLREEATYQKEKGNKYVKKEKWNEAIECYTKAIECYAYDAVFYGNRALCHLKNSNYRLAESDCTTAIQLDKTYVKAYHRRAQAREALNQLNEAHDDLLKIFDYEPDNKQSKLALAKLEKKLESVAKEAPLKTMRTEQRPKSKFTLSRQQPKIVPQNTFQNISNTSANVSSHVTSECTNVPYWPSGNNIELIKTINKAPHMRSKKPLKRIKISETDTVFDTQEQVIVQPLPSLTSNNSIIRCDDFKVVERRIDNYTNAGGEVISKNKQIKEVSQGKPNNELFSFAVPETSVQFNYDWRLLKNKPDWQYLYLKQVNPKKLKTIFHESLECDIFIGIIHILVEKFIDQNSSVYEYLLGLSEVKRFNMLAMFMTDDDKKDLWKLVEQLQADKNISKVDVDNIINKYCL